ncbi:unnamed protein product [Penicillium bialowiezense]
MRLIPLAFHIVAGLSVASQAHAGNSSYSNPILPGWHSDPSCTFVPALNDTLFCTTSSFLAFPGCPIFASNDFVNWNLVSNALNRPSQLPQILTSNNIQTGGIFASTLRFHDGTFYLITSWADPANSGVKIVVLTSNNPYNDESWSDTIYISNLAGTIDPDIFWDDDGKILMAMAGSPIQASYIDLKSGNASDLFDLWNGTGSEFPEGPHLYKKDGFYYLLVAEGGTQYGHSATIARSKSLTGPWESSPHNPFITARGTNRYFQTVGHADLFEDSNGNWWGVALSTRGGPKHYNESVYPMGRESVLYPVSWPHGEWPIADPVTGNMRGPLPSSNPNSTSLNSNSTTVTVRDPDIVDFTPGSLIPKHWVHWRAPAKPSSFTVSPPGHPNTLRLTASRANLTGDSDFNATDGQTFVGRRQTDTFFSFSVDITPNFMTKDGDEIGVTSFLNQDQHMDLGIVYNVGPKADGKISFRHRVTALGISRGPIPPVVSVPIPSSWLAEPIRLSILAANSTHHQFVAAPVGRPDLSRVLAVSDTTFISGDGAATGGLLGVYATTNGGRHSMQGYLSRWRTRNSTFYEFHDEVRERFLAGRAADRREQENCPDVLQGCLRDISLLGKYEEFCSSWQALYTRS